MWNVSTAFQWVTTRLQQHTQSFPYENHCEYYKKLVSRSRPMLFTLKHYLFLYIHSPVLLQNKKVLCRPSHIVCTVTTMNVTCTQATLRIHKNLWICQFVRQFFFFFALCLDGFIMYYFLWGPWIVKTDNCPLLLSTCHNWELLFTRPHRPLWFKIIRTTTTTAFLISNTVIPNPYSHSIAFNPQSFARLS